MYGAELNDVFKATLMEGPAVTYVECKYVVVRRAPVRPHGSPLKPISSRVARWPSNDEAEIRVVMYIFRRRDYKVVINC